LDKLNILIITPYLPYPLDAGGLVLQYAFIDELKKKANVDMLVINQKNENQQNIIKLQSLWPDVNIYSHFEDNPPVYSLKVEFIKRCKSILKTIFRYKKNTYPHKIIKETRDPWLVNLYKIKSEKLISQVKEVCNRKSYDVIQTEFQECLDLVFALPDGVKKVFVNHELRFVRLFESATKIAQDIDEYDKYLISYNKSQELALMSHYDGVVVFSQSDHDEIGNSFSPGKVFISAAPIMDNSFTQPRESEHEIEALVFVGNEAHRPNRDGLYWYAENIGEEIYNKLGLKTLVTGKWSTFTKQKLGHSQAIEFMGFVENLSEFLTNKAMVVPIRYGSGVRMKILYAMAVGCPVISTNEGFDGIDIKPEEVIVCANTPEEFIDGIETVIKSKNYSQRLIKSAFDYVRNKHSQTTVANSRLDWFKNLLDSNNENT
jgi:glycosyltransferase involved in cell wall biosynthesis